MESEEIWKPYCQEGIKSKFEISSWGRVKSYSPTSPDKPKLLSGYKNMGYHAIPTKKTDGKTLCCTCTN